MSGPGLESLLGRVGPSARRPPDLFAGSHIIALLARPLQEDPASLAPTAVPLLLTLVRVHTGVLESLVLLDLRTSLMYLSSFAMQETLVQSLGWEDPLEEG